MFSKLAGKFWKENLKKCCSFEEQKGTRYIWGNVYCWDYCLKLSFVYKTVSQISFNLFCLGNKNILSEFLRK